MAAKTVAANKAALAKAREAREKLDEDVRVKEQRQDVATATALVALEQLVEIEVCRDGVLAGVGAAVRALMEQDVSAERAAGLLGVDVGEVRRLSKVAPVEVPVASATDKRSGKPAAGDEARAKSTVTALPSQGGSEDAARRAG